MKRIIFAEINPDGEIYTDEEFEYISANTLQISEFYDHYICDYKPIIEDSCNDQILDTIKAAFESRKPIILPVDMNLMKQCNRWFGNDNDVEMFCIVPEEETMIGQMYFYGVYFNKPHSEILDELVAHIQECLYNGATRLGIGAYKDIKVTKLIHAETAFKEDKKND